MQLTAPTGFPNNVTPIRGAPNPSQCRDARRDAVWPTAAKASPKQANQKHELEIDRDRYLPSEPPCRGVVATFAKLNNRNAAPRDAMAAISPRSCLAETHVEEVEHRPPNVTARSVAATTDIDVIGTPLIAHEDLYRANPVE